MTIYCKCFYTENFKDAAGEYSIKSALGKATEAVPVTVTVGGTFVNVENGIAYTFEDATFIWDGTTWSPVYTTYDLGALTFKQTGSGDKAYQTYFNGENTVTLALGGVNNAHWDNAYSFRAGTGVGVTLNGEAVDLSTHSLKFPGSVFLDLKEIPAVGSTLVIGGTFYNATLAVEYTIEESTFTWDGTAWNAGSGAPIEYTVHVYVINANPHLIRFRRRERNQIVIVEILVRKRDQLFKATAIMPFKSTLW